MFGHFSALCMIGLLYETASMFSYLRLHSLGDNFDKINKSYGAVQVNCADAGLRRCYFINFVWEYLYFEQMPSININNTHIAQYHKKCKCNQTIKFVQLI